MRTAILYFRGRYFANSFQSKNSCPVPAHTAWYATQPATLSKDNDHLSNVDRLFKETRPVEGGSTRLWFQMLWYHPIIVL